MPKVEITDEAHEKLKAQSKLRKKNKKQVRLMSDVASEAIINTADKELRNNHEQ